MTDAWERKMFKVCTCGHRNLIHNDPTHPRQPSACWACECKQFTERKKS